MERAALLDPRRMKQEALVILRRISQGELDPACSPAAVAQLREAERGLRQQAARAKGAERELRRRQRTAERDLRQRQRQEAWRRFARAAALVYKSRRNGRPPLSPEERTTLIFERLAPALPPAAWRPPLVSLSLDPDTHLAEVTEHVRAQQR